jgi:transposase-like protein
MATFEELANKLENHSKEAVIRLLYDMTKTTKVWKIRYEQAEKEKEQISTDTENELNKLKEELKKIKEPDTQKKHAMTEPTALDKTRAKLQIAEMALKEVEDENAKLKKVLYHFPNDKRTHEDTDFENHRKAARIEEESAS